MGVNDAAVWEGDRLRTSGQVLMVLTAGVDAAQAPLQSHLVVRPGGKVGGRYGHAHDSTRESPHDRWGIDGQRVTLVNYGRIVSKMLFRPIVIEEAVVFPFHIMEFGVDIRRNRGVAPQLVAQKFETPAHVPVAIKRANAAI